MENKKLEQNYINTIPMNKFFHSPDWQTVGATVLAYVTTFFSPIVPFLMLVVALTTADLFTAINAARVNGEPLKSFGIRRTVQKIGVYWTVIICSELLVLCTNLIVQSYGFESVNLRFLTQYVVILIAYAEYQSVIENVEKATGVKIWQSIKHLFKIKK